MMKNYENRLKAIKKIADGKTAKVVIVDYKDGKYFLDGKPVDIDNIPDTPPESLKGSDIDWQEKE